MNNWLDQNSLIQMQSVNKISSDYLSRLDKRADNICIQNLQLKCSQLCLQSPQDSSIIPLSLVVDLSRGYSPNTAMVVGGITLPRKDWVLLNRFRARVGRCSNCKSKCGIKFHPSRDRISDNESHCQRLTFTCLFRRSGRYSPL